MNHRERVCVALSHQVPDRCPMQVSFTPEFASRLRNHLGQTEAAQHNPHEGGNTYALERALDQDLLLTSVGWANSYYANEKYSHGSESYTDEWGVEWRNSPYQTRFGKGYYTEMTGHPLASDEAVESYTPPDPNRRQLYDDPRRLVQEFGRDYWIVGVTVTTIFETAWALRGLEQLLMDFVLNPGLADRILDFPCQYHLTAARKLVELGVDMIWLGDDVGAQNAMMISPQTWRCFLKPRMANFTSTLKSMKRDLKVAYHSDGNITPIIPDLIEIGIDVLNPIQPKSMDPVRLKNLYGHRLCFWGSIDEQETLPFGSPADVRAEVLLRLRTLGKKGGLILGPTHHVQLDTPMENFWAMAEAIVRTPYSSV
jgi:uroporphyrinogen decarboxylase